MRGTTRFIQVWATGDLSSDVIGNEPVEAYDGTLAVVLERGAHLDPLYENGFLGSQSRVFVQRSDDGVDERSGAAVLGYEGSLSDPGGDVQIGAQFFLQTQDYGTSEYLALIGTTLIRLVDTSDFETFLSDADLARREGKFTEFATHPLVRICDITALGFAAPDRGPRLRLYVDATGEISVSPSGSKLGSVGDSLSDVEAEWARQNQSTDAPCAVALARTVDEGVRVKGLADRPWMSSYHCALAGLRTVRARGVADPSHLAVSGFGGRINSALDDIEDAADSVHVVAPVLISSREDFYLFAPAVNKTFKMGASAAKLAELLLIFGSVDAASEHASAESLHTVRRFLENAGVRLSVV